MRDNKQQQMSVFIRLVVISTLTKLSDLLVSPKTTLPWILTASAAPGWIISLLVPVKESGSLIPQWFLKTVLADTFSNHSAFWRIGALIQGAGIIVLVILMASLEGSPLAFSVLIALMIVSFGRAICSLTMKNIQGQSIDKGRRGRLIGLASSISGGLTLGSAVIYMFATNSLTRQMSYSLLICGGLLFIIALVVSLPLHISNHHHSKPNSADFFAHLKGEKDLRQLILSRILLMHSALIVPFVVATSSESQTGSGLGYFVALSALASMISSYLWGRISDKSAILTLRIAASICVVSCFAVGFGAAESAPYIDLILFFILTLGHAGIRTGRKTYLLDITETQNRTGYVAAANTSVGIALLILGSAYAVISNYIGDNVIILMSVVLLIGLIHSLFLRAEK